MKTTLDSKIDISAELQKIVEKEIKQEEIDDETQIWTSSGSLGDFQSVALKEVKKEELVETPTPTPKLKPAKPIGIRLCGLCNKLDRKEMMRCKVNDTEKLILYMAYVRSDVLSGKQAAEKCRRLEHFCMTHFEQVCQQFRDELNIKNPENLLSSPIPMLESFCKTAEEIKNVRITIPQIKQFLMSFLRKYSGTKFPPLFPPTPRISPTEVKLELPKPPILPKELRQPRKQVLEKLENDDGATMRVIKKRNWDVIDTPIPTHNDDGEEMKCPTKCVYCQLYKERCEMLRVPKTDERITKWYEQLGEEFKKRTSSDGDNYICRIHFRASAFSTRGRLLRGMVPIAPDNCIVEYKLKNSVFKQVKITPPISEKPAKKKRK